LLSYLFFIKVIKDTNFWVYTYLSETYDMVPGLDI
jgi:hypothetical protein